VRGAGQVPVLRNHRGRAGRRRPAGAAAGVRPPVGGRGSAGVAGGASPGWLRPGIQRPAGAIRTLRRRRRSFLNGRGGGRAMGEQRERKWVYLVLEKFWSYNDEYFTGADTPVLAFRTLEQA